MSVSRASQQLLRAAMDGDIDTMRKVLQPRGWMNVLPGNQVDIDAHTDIGWTALHYAVDWESEEMFRILIEHGADVNAQDQAGLTPLHVAAYYNQPYQNQLKICGILVEAGADVNAKSFDGMSPLHETARRSVLVDVSQWLIEAGADVNAKNLQGETPLVYAEWSGGEKSVALLKAETLRLQMEANTAQVPSFPDLNDPATLDQIAASQSQEPKRRGMRL